MAPCGLAQEKTLSCSTPEGAERLQTPAAEGLSSSKLPVTQVSLEQPVLVR